MSAFEQSSASEVSSQPADRIALQNISQMVSTNPMDTTSVGVERRPAKESGLRGKVVVITGAVAGIGRATALRFAEEGARVAAWDVSDKTAPELESAIKRCGGCLLYTSDAADEEDSVDIGGG